MHDSVCSYTVQYSLYSGVVVVTVCAAAAIQQRIEDETPSTTSTQYQACQLAIQSKETCGTFQHIKKSLATIVCVCIMVHSCFVSFSADSLSSSDTNYKPATRRLADSKLNWQCWTGSGSIIIFFLFPCRLMIHFDIVMRDTTEVTEVSQSVT